jgi:hypothetical protein
MFFAAGGTGVSIGSLTVGAGGISIGCEGGCPCASAEGESEVRSAAKGNQRRDERMGVRNL